MDSNAVIYFLSGNLPESSNNYIETKITENEVFISVITKMEILGFNFSSPEEEQSFNNFVNAVEVIPISDDVVNQTIIFRKMKKIKLPDAIIASTAVVHQCDIITRNLSDFNGLGITCLDPFSDL